MRMTTKKRQKLRRMTFQNEHRTNYNSGDKYYKELREQTNDKIPPFLIDLFRLLKAQDSRIH